MGASSTSDAALGEPGWLGRIGPLVPALVVGAVLILAAFGVRDRIRDARQAVEAAAWEKTARDSLVDAERLMNDNRPLVALDRVNDALDALEHRRRLLRATDTALAVELDAGARVLRGRVILANADAAPAVLDKAAADFARALSDAHLADGSARVWTPAAWYGLALARVRRGDWRGAAQSLDRLLEVNPYHGGGYALRARVCRALGDEDGHRRDRRNALRLGESGDES